MSDPGFTQPQLDALAGITGGRLAVVRAGPGSGKTRVFVEALRRELDTGNSKRRGIAALSFTNVAHEVISQRLGGEPGAPHFVGTLDGFLWRFVVRPFGHLTGVTRNGPRLIPSPIDEVLSAPVQKYGPDNRHSDTIFKITFAGGTESVPVLFHRREKLRLEEPFRSWTLTAKRNEWATNGRLTHSDSQYLASCLLNGPHGAAIVRRIARRFPVILVDEFQDTGWFLARALFTLLGSNDIRCAVVGDPDQAIFQFGGARNTLFSDAEKLPGAKSFLLEESHRCRKKVAAVATRLSRSSKQVIAREDSGDGEAILLVHRQDAPDLPAILQHLGTALEGVSDVAVVVRKRRTAQQLARVASEHSCPWKSGAGRRLARAVEHLVGGEPTLAARLVHRELADLVLNEESPTPDTIRAAGIAHQDWRRACHAVLMEAARRLEGETWDDWILRLKERVRVEADQLGRAVAARALGARFRKASEDGDEVRGSLSSPTTGRPAEILTVHQAKGREFTAAIVYAPKPHAGHSPCPSDEWWSEDEMSEEREVAFVACSRASHLLVLAVHEKTFQALQSKRPSQRNAQGSRRSRPRRPLPRCRSERYRVETQKGVDTRPGSRVLQL